MNTPKIKHALSVTRADDFAQWYQEVISEAEMAEESGVRGCMVIKPWGYGIWERIQHLVDARIKAAGVQNCYFPLFIPLSYFAKEAEHVDGFAKEMAVVTHHRLIQDGKGGLVPDPEAKLEEPLIVRPTSETVIGQAMSRWVQSWRDLPLLTNQWANVVRWEMRTRMFLRTSEFLWQEGHTAHADRDDAMAETLRALEMYRSHAEDDLAMPVIAGEKPENERFPGAVATYSIEAMMQDGKALQAGTSHYLGTGFAEAAGIKYQDKEGGQQLCHTTSWGVSTRLIGGVIMTHGDDDGLRVPPRIAPHQVVILPMLRDDDGDEALLAYCEDLRAALASQWALGEPIRVLLDKRAGKATAKRWGWVKKGVPLILEIGGRDAAGGQVSAVRRDRLYREDGKVNFVGQSREDFLAAAAAELEDIQRELHAEATARRDAQIHRGVTDLAGLEAFFSADQRYPGWVEVVWSRPTGEALEAVVAKLKALKLTIRNTPMGGEPVSGTCLFTGQPAVERIYVARAY
ncbi:aminoacyl--tRNA ligase-related protein [Novosphingobium sp.]|uniref:aminoacyl--tRNA ligase-related protein n=1 Tax=Novosphingobium sp. TaxID=1874826 RepID=UPI0022C03851|nr:aminoacyl--tRNA ligase-related protein [Novosphingobium sp.]MCZ8017327.1 His/Gly/Thr/Pro-type tRNA ligase C-terminal domain-containing protein [Novosphingobium sp.]MCZ8034150.1 His/Gly/Thr/Pro-type tRNA ligase C-terminal domain-containing protein [Novosphingobium sp.]MCZ8051505.1 His/Gly/Thr/Pro-type tRNA ligase C-terminal domain-containing protein [Novosphingobium sp.]MCZ8059851.1 His/Gly/Thr/Pro-type tRNA ligase C-terminal domain-containing protein [Novosphingobium sp.]MCZ8231689.1 His/Gl